jgi:hypothetical protein
MKISELKEKIQQNQESTKKTYEHLRDLNLELKNLQSALKKSEIDSLSEYIEIGSTYTFTKLCMFSGVQTGIKKDTKVHNPIFRQNDIIEFVKKNPKSFVIKCIKFGELNPNTTFRIDNDSVYYQLMSDKNFKLRFETFVNRKETLKDLGI